MAIGVIGIRRLTRNAHAHQRDDVGGAIGEGMEAVGQHRDRAAGQTERDLRKGNCDVEEENPGKNPRDFLVAIHVIVRNEERRTKN